MKDRFLWPAETRQVDESNGTVGETEIGGRKHMAQFERKHRRWSAVVDGRNRWCNAAHLTRNMTVPSRSKWRNVLGGGAVRAGGVRLMLLFVVCVVSFPHSIEAQIIFPERFAVILDTAKAVKGQIVPEMKFQTQKEDLLEFENNANITFRLGSNALTFANKVEFSKYGDEVFLSGGYLYSEFRKIVDDDFAFEPFGQIQWSDARGMELRYALGINARIRIRTTENMGVFAGVGAFYEHERWNYDGVADSSLIPFDVEHVDFTGAKLGFYLSFKYSPIEELFFDSSLYHQGVPGDLFTTPRLASSNGVTYSFTEHLGLTLAYQNIYDYEPLVPIEKLFNKVVSTLVVSF